MHIVVVRTDSSSSLVIYTTAAGTIGDLAVTEAQYQDEAATSMAHYALQLSLTAEIAAQVSW
jgi:hypothetical protein